METPLQITFRGLDPSPAIEDAVHKKVHKLEQRFERITSCQVLVEKPHRNQQTGELYHIRIDLAVPGREIVVGRDPAHNGSHGDVYVAIRDAFDAARRQLDEHSERRHRRVKRHEEPPRVQASVVAGPEAAPEAEDFEITED